MQDRIRNYLQKYYPLAQEVSDADVEKAGEASPARPSIAKVREELLVAQLNRRPRSRRLPPPPPPVEPCRRLWVRPRQRRGREPAELR